MRRECRVGREFEGCDRLLEGRLSQPSLAFSFTGLPPEIDKI